MLSIKRNAKFILHCEPVDLRKGFEGLAVIVQSEMKLELTSGIYVLFWNYQRNRLKILYWDKDSLAIWCKRLECAKFSPRNENKTAILDRRAFINFLKNAIPGKASNRYKIS